MMPESVSKAMLDHIRLESQIGGYEAFAAIADRIDDFYDVISRLIVARPHQIAYMTSATDAYSRALSSIPFQNGDVLLTTKDDYVSNQIAFIQLQKRNGVRIVRAENRASGEVDLDSIAGLIRLHRPKVVCRNTRADEFGAHTARS